MQGQSYAYYRYVHAYVFPKLCLQSQISGLCVEEKVECLQPNPSSGLREFVLIHKA